MFAAIDHLMMVVPRTVIDDSLNAVPPFSELALSLMFQIIGTLPELKLPAISCGRLLDEHLKAAK
jgi:hypothetical protein